jgi:hypothetical protein
VDTHFSFFIVVDKNKNGTGSPVILAQPLLRTQSDSQGESRKDLVSMPV